MKFTSTVLSALVVGVASATDFSLRGLANSVFGYYGVTNPTDSVDARIIIQGMLYQPSPTDMDIIAKSAKSTYNHAYESAGFYMDALDARINLEMPNEKAVMNGQMVLAELQVSLDASSSSSTSQQHDITATIDLAKLHQQFEENFCAGLRASGSANLVMAHDCSFSFLDKPEQEDSLVSVPTTGITTEEGNSNEAHVFLQGTLHAMTKEDLQLVDESIMAAYGEAFAAASSSSVPSLGGNEQHPNFRSVDFWVTKPSSLEDGDVSQMVLAWIWHYYPSRGWGCRFCPPDDDAVVAGEESLSEMELAYMHDAFEKSFCTKLKNSGNANFAHVHDCAFRFVANPGATGAEGELQK